jgi:hypothetical protein
MITAEQKIQITDVLGKQYSPKIISYLCEKGIKPIRADFFTPKIVQDIMTGESENIEVEIAILDLVDQVKKELRKLEQKKLKQLTAK